MDRLEGAEPDFPEVDDFFFTWRCSRDGKIAFLSDSFKPLTGLDPAISSMIPLPSFGGDMDHVLAVWEKHALTGRGFRNFPIVFSDGTRQRRVLLSGNSVVADSDPSAGFSGFGSCVETDDVAHLQKEFSDPGTVIKSVMEIACAGYILRDAVADRFRLVGPLTRIIGSGNSTVSIADIRASVLPPDVERFDAIWSREPDKNAVTEVELRFGRDAYNCSHIVFVFEACQVSEFPSTGCFAVYRDVTEQRVAETTLNQVETIARVGHWYTEAATQSTQWSAALREMFGITEGFDGALDREFFWNKIVHPEDVHVCVAERESGIREKRDYEAVVRVQSLDGRMLWVQIRGHPLLDRDGALTGTMGTIQDITPLKALEKKILQTDKWFKRAQRLGRIGHWTFERTERQIHFSEQAQEIFGSEGGGIFSLSEVLKRIHPEDRNTLGSVRNSFLKGEPGFEHKVRIFRKDGTVAHLLVAAEFDFADGGDLERTFGTIADVTAQVVAEEAIRDAEALMSDVFENADCGIRVQNLDGRFIRINTRAAIQLGLRVSDMLGHTVDEMMAKSDRIEDAELLSDAASTVVATLGTVTYDYSLKPQGKKPAAEFRVTNFPIQGPGGTVRAVASICYDITGFVQAQDALKKLNDTLERTVRTRTLELRQSEERFRNIASASADWFWELDANLNLLWCSENFFDAIGRNQADHIGKHVTSFISEKERLSDQRSAFSALLRKLEAKEQVSGFELDRDHPGGKRVFRINAMPVWNDGVFTGFHGSTADISELKQAQVRLVEADRLASLGGLVAGISHEINTPVGVSFTVVTKLTGSLSRLQDAVLNGKVTQTQFSRFLAEMDEGLGIIHRGLQRTSELIAHFKQVAVDQTSLKRREFELSEIVEDVAATMRATIGNKSLKIETNVSEGLRLDSYPGPLGQVLINLIQNAVFHAFDDDEVGRDTENRITVDGKLGRSATVTLSVTDNGKGMSPKVSRHVFEPFFTTKFGSGGSGLGMHLVYSIVHGALGGTVSVSSHLGKGTVVRVMLPLIAPVNAGSENENES